MSSATFKICKMVIVSFVVEFLLIPATPSCHNSEFNIKVDDIKIKFMDPEIPTVDVPFSVIKLLKLKKFTISSVLLK